MTRHRKKDKTYVYDGRSTITIEGPIEELNHFKQTCKEAQVSQRKFVMMQCDVWNSLSPSEKKIAKYKYNKRIKESDFKSPQELKKPYRVIGYERDLAMFSNPFELMVWVIDQFREFLNARYDGRSNNLLFKGQAWLLDAKEIFRETHNSLKEKQEE